MSTKIPQIVPVASPDESLCHGCRYWDYAIYPPQPGLIDSFWENLCLSPGEYTPGDNVTECEGFDGCQKDETPIHYTYSKTVLR